jgi:hypothetical protein
MIKELFPGMKITFSGTESTLPGTKIILPRIETMPLLKWTTDGSKVILELTKV